MQITINGAPYQVPSNLPATTSLNTFIRINAGLPGTKAMCHEGGCGVCIVCARRRHPVTGHEESFAVNSCLVPIFSCLDWHIFTIEGIGNQQIGYHILQNRLVQFSGTQCGYCSPGMVMNMYSLMADKKVTSSEIENSFGGNICRCTGYRPILDAFKSMAIDSELNQKDNNLDIEDLNLCCGKRDKCFKEMPMIRTLKESFILPDSIWHRVTTLEELLKIVSEANDTPYMILAGNTAKGVYRRKLNPKIYIDINDVAELKKYTLENNLSLGANMTLTETMDTFNKISKENKGFSYLKVLSDHIDLIANVPIRNVGSLAGNLSMKNQFHEFPSDIYLILETVGATVTIVNKSSTAELTLLQYMYYNMIRKIITKINLPTLSSDYVVKTYKIMPRAQNAHAYVNAGFCFRFSPNKNKILQKPTIVFGGINPEFTHATKTEEYLQGKNLFQQNVWRQTLDILDSELEPDHVLPDASPEYRKGLAKALFYKFVLSLAPKVKPFYISGSTILERPLSSGKQEYQSNKKVWPLNQPIPKLEAVNQCSGTAQYVNDIPTHANEVACAFVVTGVAQGEIFDIDPSDALDADGVIAFFTSKDIPGKNDFCGPLFGLVESEEILCSGKIKYAGQPYGIVVANSRDIALMAADLVRVSYSNVSKPALNLQDVLTMNKYDYIPEGYVLKPLQTPDLSKATQSIEGKVEFGSQYHYQMETQATLCVPVDDQMDVFASTQWVDCTQVAIANMLGWNESRINVVVRRLGGSFGGKITRNSQISSACALVAFKLGRPARMVLSIEDNMKICGKRYSCNSTYQANFDTKGKVISLKAELLENAGATFNEDVSHHTLQFLQASCYAKETYQLSTKSFLSDIPSNTWCRAPSSTEAHATMETIMEHISYETKIDPFDIKMANINNPALKDIIKTFVSKNKLKERTNTINLFNKNNRWKKRGIAIVPMQYPMQYFGNFAAMVSVYAQDGSVAVVHAGIEMGQGINTKVAQVTAYILGIPLDLVSVKPTNSFASPNAMVTGGSVTSESCCYAAKKACENLLSRMQPAKSGLKNPTWQEWVKAAYIKNIDLSEKYMFTDKDDVSFYFIYGVSISEVEVDILTGQHQILRVDILEDAGESLSPEVDLGQIEGAFVMGIGSFLSEELVYHPETGEILTNRTWNYKPPGAKDIPIDFRIEMLKNAPNPTGVLRSKATGEPPFNMSYVVPLAIRYALRSARKDSGAPDVWFPIDFPLTTEKIFLTAQTDSNQFQL